MFVLNNPTIHYYSDYSSKTIFQMVGAFIIIQEYKYQSYYLRHLGSLKENAIFKITVLSANNVLRERC